MDFSLSLDQQAFITHAREVLEREVAPRAEEIDEQGAFPVWVKELFREEGFFSALFPPDCGGMDGKLLTETLILEEAARASASASMILKSQSLGSTPLVLAGSDEQKRHWLAGAARGDKLLTFGLTEPNAGSDVRALATRAEYTGSGWRLNGRKCFITHADVADLMIVFAKVRDGAEDKITAFAVETEREGYVIEKVERKIGLRGSTTCTVLLDNLWVPEDSILGDIGDGFNILVGSIHKGRISVAAQAVGLAQSALETSARYTKDRVQFGVALAKMPSVRDIVANMATAVESARWLTRCAADSWDRRDPDMARLSGMAKLLSTDAAMQVTTDAVQIMGGYGCLNEYGVERMFRDAKIFQIFEGANQVQRQGIAREVYIRL